MIAILWIAFAWVVGAPIGYAVSRWSHRATFGRWTQNDRLSAIVLSVLYGPLTLVITGIIVLFDKLATSKWGNRDARW